MRTVRASEISSYIYCHRAWWYFQQGRTASNQDELQTGRDAHALHGHQVATAGATRWLAIGLLVISLMLLAAYGVIILTG